MIKNNDIDLVKFINTMKCHIDDYTRFEVKKIHELNKIKSSPFFEWQTAESDQICIHCQACYLIENGMDAKKECLYLNYYVQQFSVGDGGDSFQGTLVFPLTDCYIEIDFEM